MIRLRGCAGWSASLLFAYGESRFCHDVAHLVFINTIGPRCIKTTYSDVLMPDFIKALRWCTSIVNCKTTLLYVLTISTMKTLQYVQRTNSTKNKVHSKYRCLKITSVDGKMISLYIFRYGCVLSQASTFLSWSLTWELCHKLATCTDKRFETECAWTVYFRKRPDAKMGRRIGAAHIPNSRTFSINWASGVAHKMDEANKARVC